MDSWMHFWPLTCQESRLSSRCILQSLYLAYIWFSFVVDNMHTRSFLRSLPLPDSPYLSDAIYSFIRYCVEHLETGPALGSGGPHQTKPRACSAGASTLPHQPAVTPSQCPEEAQPEHSDVWGGKGFPQLLLSLQGPGPVPSAHQGCVLPGRACTFTVPGRSTPTYAEFHTGQGVPLTGLVWCIFLGCCKILVPLYAC